MKIEDFKMRNDFSVLQLREDGDVPLLFFPLLEETRIAEHGFTTRMGGVSEGIFSTLNLSFSRGDERSAVEENFRRLAGALGVSYEDFVFSDQTHTTNVLRVGKEHRGCGITKERGYTDVDGLVTNEPGVVLSTFYADCVPLFFIDPVHRAIGLSHSGWRGTVGRMGAVTLSVMQREFGTCAADVYAAVGPSICQDCYEVSEDVAERFREEFVRQEKPDGKRKGEEHQAVELLMVTGAYGGAGRQSEMDVRQSEADRCQRLMEWEILRPHGDGKYLLDLWRCNEIILLEAGILPEHLVVTNICTCCNPTLLFSHRASGGKRGNLGAFLYLK